MFKQAFLIYGALLLATTVGAQSLGDVATREKKRRAKIEKSEPTKLITESELSGGREVEAPDPSSESEANGSSLDRKPGDRPVIPAAVLPSTDAESEAGTGAGAQTPSTDSWDETFAEYQKAYNEGKAFLQFAQSFQKHCEDGTPPPPLPPVEGGYWMVNCDSFPEEIAQTRRLMKQLQDACSNDARRLGILPGRARLR